MYRTPLHPPEPQKNGVSGREDICGDNKGKDGSPTMVTLYNPIRAPEEQYKGTVFGGDNIGRDTRDIDPIPTWMTTNSPLYASSHLPEEQQKQKSALMQEDNKRDGIAGVFPKEQRRKSSFGGREHTTIRESGDIAPNLGEKTAYRPGYESSSALKEQPKSLVKQEDFSDNGRSGTKPNPAVDYPGYDTFLSSKKNGALTVGNIDQDDMSKEQQNNFPRREETNNDGILYPPDASVGVPFPYVFEKNIGVPLCRPQSQGGPFYPRRDKGLQPEDMPQYDRSGRVHMNIFPPLIPSNEKPKHQDNKNNGIPFYEEPHKGRQPEDIHKNVRRENVPMAVNDYSQPIRPMKSRSKKIITKMEKDLVVVTAAP